MGALTGFTNDTGITTDKNSITRPLMETVSKDQLDKAQADSNAALVQQQNFVNALQSQGSQGMASQSALTNMLTNQANGVGPNPAQAALNQQTSNNIAQQSALMAGQRGSGANAGLIARQAAMQGGNLQQQAVGQGATLQAQQQLAAQQQLQNLAGTQVGQQGSGLQQYVGNTQNEQGSLLNAAGGLNAASVGQQGVSAGIAKANQDTTGKLVGGLTGAAGSAIGLAHGGNVPHLAAGGTDFSMFGTTQGPASNIGKYHAMGPIATPQYATGAKTGDEAIGQGFANLGAGLQSRLHPPKAPDIAAGATPMIMPAARDDVMVANKGGKVPAMVSPGEGYLPPDKASRVAHNRASVREAEVIPGKAKVKGDSLKNDTVPKSLEQGGIVIPRTAMASEEKAAAFVKAHFAKRGSLPKKD